MWVFYISNLKKGFAMSIMGKTIPSDALYPVTVLVIVQEVKKWLDKEKGGEEFSLERFRRILDEMVAETPFAPGRFDSREPPPHIPIGEEFRYRRPVWQLIRDQLNMSGSLIQLPSKKQVRWLVSQLALCLQYGQYEIVLGNFRREVQGLGLSFHSGPYNGFLDGDVYVQGAFEEKGENARKNIKKIIKALIPVLTKHIEEVRGK